MNPLPRDGIEGLVRAVEDDAYGYARAAVDHGADIDTIVLQAFEDVARSFPVSSVVDLTGKLRARIRIRGQTGGGQRMARFSRWRVSTREAESLSHRPVWVPSELHVKLVDRVEELQSVESTARRKAALLSLLGAAVVATVVAVVWVRFDALRTARPIIAAVFPLTEAGGVPVQGEFRVIFRRSPSSAPHLTLQPADGQVGSQAWDGTTLIVSYAGLHHDAPYHLVLDGDYVSRFKDHGHFQQQWSFTTEGYPTLVGVQPLSGATGVPRSGVLLVDFNHPAFVAPLVTFQPPDGTIVSGIWVGQSWVANYRSLKPSTTYQATVIVDYGVKKANIKHSWTFTTEPGIPPTGIPVLWHSRDDPANFSNPPRMIALDWNGNLAGTRYAPVTVQSPDGSIVGTADGTYLDATGARLGPLSGVPYYPVIADDDRSVCELSGSANGGVMDQLWLMFGPVRGPLHPVAPAGALGARSGLGIIACSALNDRAVIVYSAIGGPSSVKIFALSSGRLLYQHGYTLAVSNIISSRDGRYLGETMPVHGSDGVPSMTVIRRTSDGAVAAQLNNAVGARFSWDDQRLVVSTPFQAGAPNVVSLIAWQSAKVIWTCPSPPARARRFSPGPSPMVRGWRSPPRPGRRGRSTSCGSSMPMGEPSSPSRTCFMRRRSRAFDPIDR